MPKLKSLFLFNGLLLLIAFMLIQYSVVSHEEDTDETVNADLIASYESVLADQPSHNPILNGEVAQRTIIFDQPLTIPNLEFKTAFDKAMSLDDVKGQWIILNLWATWCPPCIREMPSLQALQDEYGNQGLRVIAVSLDRNMDGKTLRWFMGEKGFGPVAAYYGDYPTYKEQIEFRGLPYSYIVSPNGQAIGVVQGELDWISADAKAFIESLLYSSSRAEATPKPRDLSN
jgi:thiol-disulfide isomerase/thioredoxin